MFFSYIHRFPHHIYIYIYSVLRFIFQATAASHPMEASHPSNVTKVFGTSEEQAELEVQCVAHEGSMDENGIYLLTYIG